MNMTGRAGQVATQVGSGGARADKYIPSTVALQLETVGERLVELPIENLDVSLFRVTAGDALHHGGQSAWNPSKLHVAHDHRDSGDDA